MKAMAMTACFLTARTVLTCAAALLAASAAAIAASPAEPKPGKGIQSRASEKWNSLSRDQRRKIIGEYRRWKALPAEEKERLRANFEKYSRPAAQTGGGAGPKQAPGRWNELLANFSSWSSMTQSQKKRLMDCHKILKNVPEERISRVMRLEPGERARALQEMVEEARLNGLARQFSSGEKAAIRTLKGGEKRAEIRRILAERSKEQIKRIPAGTAERIRRLGRAEAEAETRKELERISYRDQALVSLLDSQARREFASLPVGERDSWGARKLGSMAPGIEGMLPEGASKGLDGIPEPERLWKAVSLAFDRRLERLSSRLTPAQSAEVASLGPARRAERIAQHLAQNHRRILASIPISLRREIEGKSGDLQRKAVSEYIESRIPRDFWLSLSRADQDRFLKLPLVLRLKAVEQARKARKSAGASGGKE